MDSPEQVHVHPVLPGLSLWQWVRVVFVALAALLPLILLLSGTIIATQSWVSNPVVSALLIVIGFGFVMTIIGNIMVRLVRDKEFAAGYTTSRGGYLQFDQVDEATGLVVREAGEPAITRAQYRAKIDAFRATQTKRK